MQVYVRKDISETATLADMISAVQSAQGVTSILNDKTDILKESQIVYHAPQEVIEEQTLDFTALENKLVEVIESKLYGITNTKLINYSKNNQEIYMIYEYERNSQSSVTAYKASLGDNKLETQEEIDNFVSQISSDNLTGLGLTMQKSTSDITANGETYSKAGIEGDNAFARQCGVDNAIMTWVSTPSSRSFDERFSTGYSKTVQVLILTQNNNELIIEKNEIVAEDYSGYTDEQVYTNALNEEKSIIGNATQFNLGQNLKPEAEAV